MGQPLELVGRPHARRACLRRGSRLVAVSLVDSHLCADPGKYLAALLLSLATMLHLELPQVNLLSKADTVAALGRLAFSLDYYTEVGPRAAPRPARPLMHDVQCGQARRRVPYTPLLHGTDGPRRLPPGVHALRRLGRLGTPQPRQGPCRRICVG